MDKKLTEADIVDVLLEFKTIFSCKGEVLPVKVNRDVVRPIARAILPEQG